MDLEIKSNEAQEKAEDSINTPHVCSEERTVVLEEAIEAILFAAGHPISYATLARVFETTPTVIRDTVANYSLKYNNSTLPRGVLLLTYSDSCQLCTKKHYLSEIREALGIKKNGTLSTSAMETLAIVAYNQPVTRLFVDTLRKVDSSYAMNSLIDRGLIECKGRLDVPGRPMLYGTTLDFLRSFGLDSLDSLPKTTEEMVEAFSKVKLTGQSENSDELNGKEQVTILSDNKLSNTSSENAEESTLIGFTDEPEEPSAEDDIITDY